MGEPSLEIVMGSQNTDLQVFKITNIAKRKRQKANRPQKWEV